MQRRVYRDPCLQVVTTSLKMYEDGCVHMRCPRGPRPSSFLVTSCAPALSYPTKHLLRDFSILPFSFSIPCFSLPFQRRRRKLTSGILGWLKFKRSVVKASSQCICRRLREPLHLPSSRRTIGTHGSSVTSPSAALCRAESSGVEWSQPPLLPA